MPLILQINSVVNTGSTGRSAEELGDILLKNNWESYIAYGRNQIQSTSNLLKIGSYYDVIIHGLMTRVMDYHGFGSKHATFHLIKEIKKIQPDIIHLRNLHGYYINIEILFTYLASSRIPVVWTFHDCWPMTGHCTHFDHVGCNKWKTECFNCPQKKEYPASFILDQSKKNHRIKKELFTSINNLTIVPVSEWLGDIVKESFFSKYPVNVIYNGIDTNKFKANQDNHLQKKINQNNKFLIVGISNIWNQRKGLNDFIELSKKLDSSFQIILIGLNKSQIFKLPSNIIGISRTDSIEELVNIFSIADVYFNPSVEETFGKTTVEAMACGTPVIVYNATASPELITPETGFIIEKGDLQGVLNAIEIIKNKGKKSFSIACRNRVEKLYNSNIQWIKYLNLYKSILKQQSDSTN